MKNYPNKMLVPESLNNRKKQPHILTKNSRKKINKIKQSNGVK